MADPTKMPGNSDPDNVPRRSVVDPRNGPIIRPRRGYAWAWIIGVIIVLLILWSIFGLSHRTRIVNPDVQPAQAASAVR